MPGDYPWSSTKNSDHCCLTVGLHKLLMDTPESINQLRTVGVAAPSGVLHHSLVLCSFMLIVPGLRLGASWKGWNIPSCHQQLVLKPPKKNLECSYSVISTLS